MRKIFSLPVKLLAAFLGLVLAMIVGAGIFGIICLLGMDIYGNDSFVQSALVSEQLYEDGEKAALSYYTEYKLLEEMQESDDSDSLIFLKQDVAYWINYFDDANTNFRFAIYAEADDFNRSLGSLEEVGSHFYTMNELVEFQAGDNDHIRVFTYYDYSSDDEDASEIIVVCTVAQPLVADDDYAEIKAQYDFYYKYRYTVPMVSVAALVLLAAVYAYLLAAAGRKRAEDGSEVIVAGGLHKVPMDVLTVVFLTFLVTTIKVMLDVMSYLYYGSAYFLLHEVSFACLSAACFAAIGYVLILVYSMSFAVRVKLHTFASGLLVRKLLENLPSSFIGLLFVAAGAFLLLHYARDSRIYPVIILVTVAAAAWVIQSAYKNRVRRTSIHNIAQGDLSDQKVARGLIGAEKTEAEDVNKIKNGLSSAVERQLKSERLKTELITNVSHDIKTPLTSIINYVDLLEKEGVHSEQEQEYLDILKKQSTRMKKLIEDLIDASKASTGNMQVDTAPINMRELVGQLSGEYVERFKAQDLDLVVTLPDHNSMVLADGRLLWRIFDNLLSNALKYSQPGTRVYMDLVEGDKMVTVTLRNISSYPLNITEGELMERFVRADKSRHTEGSGLGLSIVHSLTTLLKGKFRIVIDGDLFKTYVSMPKVNAGAPAGAALSGGATALSGDATAEPLSPTAENT